MRALSGGLLLFGLVHAGAASACSVFGGYKAPTGLELAAKADMIVVAQVDGDRPGTDPQRDFGLGSVLATPQVVLKGQGLPPRIEIRGAILSDDPGQSFRSAPRELRAPNEGALTGGCTRYVFAMGMKLLLFLKRDAGGTFVPVRATFARDAEDVRGPDALWVKAMREYAAISTLPHDHWAGALRRRIRALRARGDADATAIAVDMETELHGQRCYIAC